MRYYLKEYCLIDCKKCNKKAEIVYQQDIGANDITPVDNCFVCFEFTYVYQYKRFEKLTLLDRLGKIIKLNEGTPELYWAK